MAHSKSKQVLLPSLIEQIQFNNIDLSYTLKNKRALRSWIYQTASAEQKQIEFIGYNFCSDAHLLRMNKKYLRHDTYTDIITFQLSEGKLISGDIYISLERVRENAKLHNKLFLDELRRVLIHGVLHLCGYKDKKHSEIQTMRNKEDHYLSLWK